MTTERLDGFVQAALTGLTASQIAGDYNAIGEWSLKYALAAMAAVDAHMASANAEVGTKRYSDGTTATGLPPLPALSPKQLLMIMHLDAIEAMLGGSNGPTIQLRSFVNSEGDV